MGALRLLAALLRVILAVAIAGRPEIDARGPGPYLTLLNNTESFEIVDQAGWWEHAERLNGNWADVHHNSTWRSPSCPWCIEELKVGPGRDGLPRMHTSLSSCRISRLCRPAVPLEVPFSRGTLPCRRAVD